MSTTTRTRVTDTRVPSRYFQAHVYQGSTTHFDHDTGTTGIYKSIKDNNNGNFRKVQRKGSIILSDCVIGSVERTVSPGSLSAYNPSVGGLPWSGSASGDCSEWLAGWPPNQGVNVDTLSTSVLLIKAYAKMKASGVMSGETLLTLGQTVGMLRSPFRSATNILKQMLKRKNWNMLGKRNTDDMIYRAIADAWLESRYGWKPIMMDIEHIILNAHKVREQCDLRRLVARAGASADGNVNEFAAATPSFTRSVNYVASSKVRRSAGVLYDVKSRTTSDELLALLGLRPSDAPALIWELTPWSFVADWFANVGEWIQAVTPVPGLTPLGHWETSVKETTFTKSGTVIGAPTVNGVIDWHGYAGSETVKTYDFTRFCNLPLATTPELTAKPLSTLHQADAMALMCGSIMTALSGFRH